MTDLIFGILAAVIGGASSIPQVWKACRTGKTADLHWLSMTLRCTSGFCWIAYAVDQKEWVLFGSSASVVLLETSLLLMKLLSQYRSKNQQHDRENNG